MSPAISSTKFLFHIGNYRPGSGANSNETRNATQSTVADSLVDFRVAARLIHSIPLQSSLTDNQLSVSIQHQAAHNPVHRPSLPPHPNFQVNFQVDLAGFCESGASGGIVQEAISLIISLLQFSVWLFAVIPLFFSLSLSFYLFFFASFSWWLNRDVPLNRRRFSTADLHINQRSKYRLCQIKRHAKYIDKSFKRL